MTWTLLQLGTAGFLPVLFAMIFYWAEKNTRFAEFSSTRKQMVVGVIYGILGILSTEFGIPVEGAILNVRNAAPLTAGLVFGWPAGIIAGLISGIARWFSSIWGDGEFTRLACTLGTILAGILSALVRKFMMDNKKTSWFYGLLIGIVCEVIHMLLIFLTNMDELQRAFDAVQRCAIPMILANGLSVMLSMMLVVRMSGKPERQIAQIRKISQSFQRWLLLCVIVAFGVTMVFTYYFQTGLALSNVEVLLRQNLRDVQNDIMDASDSSLLRVTREIAYNLPAAPNHNSIKALTNIFNVAEINVVSPKGVVIASSTGGVEGFNMSTGEQAAEFLVLLKGEQKEFVQNYQPTTHDPRLLRKYAAVALDNGGFVQVGLDAERFQDEITQQVVMAAINRHVGQTGNIIICNEDGVVVSDRHGNEGEIISLIQEGDQGVLYNQNILFNESIYGISSYCMYSVCEGYYVLATQPITEAMFSRNVAVYILAFMETIVFAALFANIFFLIKKQVVENIQKVNTSLGQITGGDLSVTVNVRTNEEFASLSDDINSTVETLRHYIDEAAARIDKELEFARKIQHSALPSVFPPFPQCNEFSIFASMDAAREIGGDFYDFYLLNENQLLFLIADVSGKGIPAAMFMMTAKTMIKGLMEGGNDVDETFTMANNRLCEGNDAGMFVTAWLGVLDFRTGKLKYVNAGHNPPAIKRVNGKYEFMKSRVNLVLAGMNGTKYVKQEIALQPGDEIYLYTDGVTEAQDSGCRLFGEERLLESLNSATNCTVDEVCKKVRNDVDFFVGNADQFDDITMLCVRLTPSEDANVLVTVPDLESMEQVSSYMDQQGERLALSGSILGKLKVVVDEIYSNIVRYSGATRAELDCSVYGSRLKLRFRDNGKPYNPLNASIPDVKASAEEREIGGLGIYMVRKLMDTMDYEYTYGMNRVTMTLVIPAEVQSKTREGEK